MIYVVGGSTNAFAYIYVKYPSGSTCTCSDGTRTLKAKDTTGYWTFGVPSSGTWTVTITDGTNTKSKDVSVTLEHGTYTVTLAYKLEIITGGVIKLTSFGNKKLLTSSYAMSGAAKSGYYEVKDDYGGGNSIVNALLSNATVNMAEYSKMVMNVTITQSAIDNYTYSGGWANWWYCGYTKNYNNASGVFTGIKKLECTSFKAGTNTLTLALPSSGSYYVGAGCASTAAGGTMRIVDFYLE